MSNVAVTLGIIEIGVSVSVFLFGLSTIQVYSYHSRFPNDPIQLKAFVRIKSLRFVQLTYFALCRCTSCGMQGICQRGIHRIDTPNAGYWN